MLVLNVNNSQKMLLWPFNSPYWRMRIQNALLLYRGAYHTGSKSETSEARKREEQRKKKRTGDWTLQITDEKELALYLDPWEENLMNFVMSQIYMKSSKSIQYIIHIKNRQSLSTRSVWFPLFCCGSWKTSSWFLLYIGSAQLIRRQVKIDQLWICFSFWWTIFNNRLTPVRIDICHSISWCLYWESFIAFNFIYISNKT